MRTSIGEVVGSECPLIASSHCRDVIAAVTMAGGFGVVRRRKAMVEECIDTFERLQALNEG
jgi:hypothetical protein